MPKKKKAAHQAPPPNDPPFVQSVTPEQATAIQRMMDALAKLPQPKPKPQRRPHPLDLGDSAPRPVAAPKPRKTRKPRSDKGQSQLLPDEQEIEQTQERYSRFLDENPQKKWRRPQTAAKHIAVEFLKRPEGSWQTIRDLIVFPVLERRDLLKKQ
ncbi:hypothetical protein [Bradyrhizobium sp. Leo170]|uniref:hypothetical protein n=1 Tax=Bradyrhizobium sp. Leo170 TaxID=1571199 RepID=UPI00102ECE99|nr:hypothetical protein [Bradyrhizobium sp. Leo170]TAI63930.1 hypothetical protein CWO89_21655 [Bradyrhizobium sp. Leo170]